jgi:hypothetical protein
MSQPNPAEVSEAEIAAHWQEEDYISPPGRVAILPICQRPVPEKSSGVSSAHFEQGGPW